MRESDTLARLGGDEFVILLPSIVDKTDALRVAEKIHAALAQPFVIDGHAIHISTSLGIALYPEHGHTEDHLLNSADSAMYASKVRGRNHVEFYSADLSVARAGLAARR